MPYTAAHYDVKKLASELGKTESELAAAMKASRRGGVARVWKAEEKDINGFKFFNVQLSTSSRRNAESPYETDFNGFATFAGAAYDKMKSLNISDRGITIVLLDAVVTSKYDKKTNKTYTNYTVRDFDVFESSGASSSPAPTPEKKAEPKQEAQAQEDELPF